MPPSSDAIFVDHESQLIYRPKRRELVLIGALLAVVALVGLITRDAFTVCLGIYMSASLLAGLGLTWIVRQGAERDGAGIPSVPHLIMMVLGYLSAVALPVGATSLLLSRAVSSNAGPLPDFADHLNTFGAIAAVLAPIVEMLFRTWAIRVARTRHAEIVAKEGTSHQMASLEKLAYQDPLTDLPNRRCFEESLSLLSAQGQEFAVMFIDFDKFKPINDLHGHAVGDEFLKAIAERISSLVRASDLVARLGGDEFAVLIKGNDAHSASKHLAERFTTAMQQPVTCMGVDLLSSASVGIAVGRGGIDDVEQVVNQADLAMYEAKRGGGARYCMAS